MTDLLETPAHRVLQVLVKEGTINMRRFTQASGHAPRHAKALRERMEEEGLVLVREEKVGMIGTDLEISATPEGKAVGERSLEMKQIHEKAAKKRRS